MRLVDADKLEEHLFVGADYDKAIDDGIAKTAEEVFAFQCGWNDALKSVVQFAPTVDAVEVVRCENCKFFEDEDGDGDCWCYCHNDITCRDGYCYWGERRKNEDK